MKNEVEKMIKSASEEKDPLKAMQFAQAALNAANAHRVLIDAKMAEQK